MSRRPSCTCGRKDCQRCQKVAKNRRWKARRAKAVPPAKLVKGGGYPPAMWELGLAPDADDDHVPCPHGSTWLDCLDCGDEDRLARAAARAVDKDQMMVDADEGSR